MIEGTLTLTEIQETSPSSIVHQGIIQLSSGLVESGHLIPAKVLALDSVSVQGQLRDEGIFAEVHRNLLLPDSYTVLGIFYDCWNRCWNIAVECEDIPPTEEGNQLPIVEPYYVRSDDGMVHLTHINFTHWFTNKVRA
jgi:hypothetical protein